MTRTSDVMLPDFVQGIGPEFQQGLRGLTWEGRPPKQPRLLKSWAQSTSCCSEKRVIMPVLMAFTASMAPTVEKVQQLPHLPCHAQRFWTLSLLWLFPAPPRTVCTATPRRKDTLFPFLLHMPRTPHNSSQRVHSSRGASKASVPQRWLVPLGKP